MFASAKKKRLASKAPTQAAKWHAELEKLCQEQQRFQEYSTKFPGISKVLQRTIADLHADLAKVHGPNHPGGLKNPKRQERALQRALSYRKRVPVYHALVANSDPPQLMHKPGLIVSFISRLKGKRKARQYQVGQSSPVETPVAEPAVTSEESIAAQAEAQNEKLRQTAKGKKTQGAKQTLPLLYPPLEAKDR
jgi:hypothetical protein